MDAGVLVNGASESCLFCLALLRGIVERALTVKHGAARFGTCTNNSPENGHGSVLFSLRRLIGRQEVWPVQL